MNRVKKSAIILVCVLFAAALLLVGAPMIAAMAFLPEEIVLTDGREEVLDLKLPFTIRVKSEEAVDVVKFNGNSLADVDTYNMGEPLTISSEKPGSANVTVDYLGFIPIKNITVTVSDERYVMPGGQSIGVMLYTNGALVVGTMDMITTGGETINPAREAGLLPGDVIEKVNGVEITDAEHLSQLVNNATGDAIEIVASRDGKSKTFSVTPKIDAEDGMLKLGVWVRDSTAGVGTLSFYDPKTKNLGGLGHAISDADTGSALSVKEGEIIESDIFEIVKGEAGEPGELKGSFDADESVIGNIEKNTQFGIYGKATGNIENELFTEPVQVGSRSEVHTGAASLLCTLNDEGIGEYSCKITKVNRQASPQQKSFVVEIDDPRLLALTGGIVQGM